MSWKLICPTNENGRRVKEEPNDGWNEKEEEKPKKKILTQLNRKVKILKAKGERKVWREEGERERNNKKQKREREVFKERNIKRKKNLKKKNQMTKSEAEFTKKSFFFLINWEKNYKKYREFFKKKSLENKRNLTKTQNIPEKIRMKKIQKLQPKRLMNKIIY